MENLSDAEIRQGLIAKGVDAPPVTDTSRALLLKKLKKLEQARGPARPAASSAPAPAVDQYDGNARRTRHSERNRDSSPELLHDRYVADASPPRSASSPSRTTRSARRETPAVDRIDMMASSVKNSTPYADANLAKGGGDPFEKGSDSDDSFYSSSRGAGSRHLARKPIGLRRESEYFTAPSAYRKHDALNGASPYASRAATTRYARGGGGKSLLSGLSRKLLTPTLVLTACLVFFVVVGGIYYSKNDRMYNDLSVNVLEQPRCSVRAGPGVPCIKDDEMPSAIDFLRMLYRALYRRKLAAVCHGAGDGVKSSRLSEDDVAEMFLMETGQLRHECEKKVQQMKVLVEANPYLRIAWSAGDGFELEDLSLPWSCALRIWCGWLWDYMMYAVATVALLFSMHILVSWATTRHKEQAKEKQELIKNIMEILQQHANTNPAQSYLPIVHVRDSLIAFADRHRKRKMWAEAVRYIEENESRVRKEVQPFEGEDYDVWRWVGGHQQSAPKPKTWQGEAFETSKDTMNTPSTSPTPCLKIRHMFDPEKETADEDWGTGVKDAILERCEGVNIVHMVVEENSPEGCVYIKCASTDDAGKAYRKIHGAWFDGKIVTVKFLRLERYHERFPASVNLNKPLIPSNDQKRSLA